MAAVHKLQDNFLTSFNDQEATSVWKNLATEYSAMYPVWPRSSNRVVRPPSNGKFAYDTSGSHDMNTMYSGNYITHPRSKPITNKTYSNKSYRLAPGNGAMDCLSTYGNSYGYKRAENRRPFRPPRLDYAQSQAEEHDIEKYSVNQRTFREYTKPEVEKARRRPIIMQVKNNVFPGASKVCIPFETTVGTSYTPHGTIMPQKAIIPQQEMFRSQSEMEMKSTQKVDYTYNSKNTDNPFKPEKNRLKIQKERQAKYDIGPHTTTTCQNDYTPHPGKHQPKSFKPIQKYIAPDMPFQLGSLYTEDFTDKTPKGFLQNFFVQTHNQKDLKKGPFYSAPLYKDVYKKVHMIGHRPKVKKPNTEYRGDAMPFIRSTTYSSDYTITDPLRIAPERFMPVYPFRLGRKLSIMESTTHGHFKGVYGPASKICRPKVKRRLSEIFYKNF